MKWEEKQQYGYFKRQTGEIAREKRGWILSSSSGVQSRQLRKGNPKRETATLLTAAQNNAMRTNYIKVKIEDT